jgi:hypothetical protein
LTIGAVSGAEGVFRIFSDFAVGVLGLLGRRKSVLSASSGY